MSRRSFGVGVVIILGIFIRFFGVAAYPPGFSYSKFTGPVSGPEHEITVKGEYGKPAVDYVAKPDYQFEYGVEDPKSNVKQRRREARKGDEVIGEYSVVQPDGAVRTVKYKADKETGFQAQVYLDGKLVEHGKDSDESASASLEVRHNFIGSHSMERPTYRGGSASGSHSNSLGRSSEENGDDDDDEDSYDDDGTDEDED